MISLGGFDGVHNSCIMRFSGGGTGADNNFSVNLHTGSSAFSASIVNFTSTGFTIRWVVQVANVDAGTVNFFMSVI